MDQFDALSLGCGRPVSPVQVHTAHIPQQGFAKKQLAEQFK
jgi:hypothetical protein